MARKRAGNVRKHHCTNLLGSSRGEQSGGLLGWEASEELSAELVDPHRSLNIVPTAILLNPDIVTANKL